MPTPDLTQARFLAVEAEVRYWEDAEVNGQPEDDDAPTIPLKQGELWVPVIELASGQIQDWPAGTTARTHYKVCDAGRYALLDAQRAEIVAIEGYVPDMLAPEGRGFGDYIILAIGPDGTIAHWKANLDAFAPR